MMTDYLDPEAPSPDPHASERLTYKPRRIPGVRVFVCRHCELDIRDHINDRFCPEWRLRELDGDR